jgi:osmotically inducible lipoprotein OsmB
MAMSKYLIVLGFALAGLTACGSNPGRGETIGTVGGAAAGGAIGSAVTGGSTIGTVGGAVAGGVIGNQAGERYDERHRK